MAADPKLKNSPLPGGSPSPQNSNLAQLPAGFPSEIPIYPQANLQEVTPTTSQSPDNQSTGAGQGQTTRWTTSDPSNFVQSFYQQQLQANGWQLLSQSNEGNATTSTIVARRNNLKVTVSIPTASVPTATATSTPQPAATTPSPTPSQSSGGSTEFTLQYVGETNAAAAPQPSPSDVAASPQPSGGGVNTASPQPSATPSDTAGGSSVFTDINKAPAELRPYIQELAALGVLTPAPSGSKTNSSASGTQFDPNKIITRREYARWLVAANNQINANRRDRQIRLASDSSQPAFTDVPRTDPDFPAIQGLAEAGLIPSPLSGDATVVLFRPDAPLTRENLILWKQPLDTRTALPQASLDAVKQTWGFQDAAKIDPRALRAVLADFQNGDNSNIRRVFGYTTLFQPQKPVTRAEAAAALWYFGSQSEGLSAKDALQIKQQQSQPSATAQPTPSTSPSR